YLEAVVTSLKKSGLLRTYYRDRLRGYRLGAKAKAALLDGWPERFSPYLTGDTDTNRLKSEENRRLRLHRLAETYVTMDNVGIGLFQEEKPKGVGRARGRDRRTARVQNVTGVQTCALPIWGYRLGAKAKAALLDGWPERFSPYLTGDTDTNRLKSEVNRRLRLHRLAETYVTMDNVGIGLFQDEKPK